MIDVVTQIRGNTGLIINDVVTRLRGQTASGRADVVTRIRGTNPTVGFTVSFAPPGIPSAPAFQVIPLTVNPSQTADTVVVTQTAGTTVVIAGSGLARSVVAPGTLNGTTLSFLVTVTKAGFANATATYTLPIRAHGGFYRKTGAAVQTRGVVRAGVPLFVDTGDVLLDSGFLLGS